MYNTTLVFTGAPVAPFPGLWLIADGCATSKAAAVVNWLSKFASAFPDRSCTPLVATTVTMLEPGSNGTGVSDTTRLSGDRLNEKVNFTPFANSPRVFALIVLAFKDFENVNTTVAFRPIPVAPFPGVTDTTCGGVVSATIAVVNELWKLLAFLLPDISCTPLGITSTNTVVLPGKGVSGVNVTVVPLTA